MQGTWKTVHGTIPWIKGRGWIVGTGTCKGDTEDSRICTIGTAYHDTLRTIPTRVGIMMANLDMSENDSMIDPICRVELMLA